MHGPINIRFTVQILFKTEYRATNFWSLGYSIVSFCVNSLPRYSRINRSVSVSSFLFIIATGNQHSANELSMACDRLTNIWCAALRWTLFLEKTTIQWKGGKRQCKHLLYLLDHTATYCRIGSFVSLFLNSWESKEHGFFVEGIRHKILALPLIRQQIRLRKLRIYRSSQVCTLCSSPVRGWTAN